MADPLVTKEVQRKLFHSLMVCVALVNAVGLALFGIPHGVLLSIGFTGITLVFFLGIEITRIRVYGYFPFKRILARVMRPRERTRLGASVYFAVGTMITFVALYIISNILQTFFDITAIWTLSGWLAVGAVMVAAIGDGMAAIIGMRFGKHRIGGNRTLEGALAGFLFGFLAFLPLWFLLNIPLIYGLIAALMLFIVDISAPPLDDNLLNPIAIGLTLAFFEIIFTMFLLGGVG
ncbi:MAG: diacylglycerol/polyprenol kinase family protein [Promethearchaeota archaeon]